MAGKTPTAKAASYLKNPARGVMRGWAVAALALAAACQKPDAPPPEDPLVEKGRHLFFNETFGGNGRTCATCHRLEDNFSISPAFIATLPPDDPLFVAETNPDLAEHFESPALMRGHGLILENLDGFDDPASLFTMRGVPHTLALKTSTGSANGPRLGWSGDGAPGDGSLRAFATGAVIQHFSKTMLRIPGKDFRLPTEEELDALEAFQLSLGRQEDPVLPIALAGARAMRGQAIFLDDARGKCNLCHRNGGANASLGGTDLGNANFDTGVENFPDAREPALPHDNGFSVEGDGTFNTPPVIEAADTPPFFHNNIALTLEEAVAFYNSAAFNNSPAGRALAARDPNGVGIALSAEEVGDVAAFLRLLNALENIRVSLDLIEKRSDVALYQARFEVADAAEVLEGAGLNQDAVRKIRQARRAVELAEKREGGERAVVLGHAERHLIAARAKLTGGETEQVP